MYGNMVNSCQGEARGGNVPRSKKVCSTRFVNAAMAGSSVSAARPRELLAGKPLDLSRCWARVGRSRFQDERYWNRPS